MKTSREHNSFDENDDQNLRRSIIVYHGYFDEEQYIFSKRLCEELIKQKKTNVDLAMAIGSSKSAITNYTKGYRIPTPKQLQKIAFSLGVTADYLLGKTNTDDISIAEVEDMLGLYENAMRVLYLLNHDVKEVQDLRDKNPLSNNNKRKLNIFNLLIQDRNFITLLCYFERYIEEKQKIENKENEEKFFTEVDPDKLIRNTRNNNKVII